MCLGCGCAVGTFQPVTDVDQDPLEHVHCPECGCDLDARPPMSYAEMEGLAQQEPSRADAWATALEARLIERWMGTTFVILLLAIILLDLLLG